MYCPFLSSLVEVDKHKEIVKEKLLRVVEHLENLVRWEHIHMEEDINCFVKNGYKYPEFTESEILLNELKKFLGNKKNEREI